MGASFELETIWGARLRAVREALRGHETRIAALESARGQPSSMNWRRLAKLAFSGISFIVRHGGVLLAGATMAWGFLLPGLKWLWRAITGFVGYVMGVGIGA